MPNMREIRERIGDNPQYTELINHYNAHMSNVAKPLVNTIAKLKKEDIPVPEELTRQIEHLKK